MDFPWTSPCIQFGRESEIMVSYSGGTEGRVNSIHTWGASTSSWCCKFSVRSKFGYIFESKPIPRTPISRSQIKTIAICKLILCVRSPGGGVAWGGVVFRSASGGFLLRLWVLGTGAFGLRVVCWGAGFLWSFVFRFWLALVGIVCSAGIWLRGGSS